MSLESKRGNAGVDEERPENGNFGGAPIRYLQAVRTVLDHLESTQIPAVEAAADLVVTALRNRGAIFCWEIGHGVQQDFINRAGGLAAVRAFSFGINLSNTLPGILEKRSRNEEVDLEAETIRLAVKAGNLRAGDVLLLGSVSGKSAKPVELALACRELGVKTIGFTSLTYTAQVESLHSSGKKLCDVVDVAIDNGAPYGDAAVEIPGLRDRKALPVSGVGMAVAGWMIWGRAIEKMGAEGDPPTVFMSLNREGGREIYEKSIALYEERGY